MTSTIPSQTPSKARELTLRLLGSAALMVLAAGACRSAQAGPQPPDMGHGSEPAMQQMQPPGSTPEHAPAERAMPATANALHGGDNRSVDVALAHQVKSKIIGDAQTRHARIDVSARNGVVTLTGNAKSKDQAQAAEQLARTTGGVKKVYDKIQIASAAGSAPPDAKPSSPPT